MDFRSLPFWGRGSAARHAGGAVSARALFRPGNPRDLARMETPQLTLEDLEGLIVIDEIQRLPEIFPLIRYLVDTEPGQKYLILGSASRDLIRQSSETWLDGSPFTISAVFGFTISVAKTSKLSGYEGACQTPIRQKTRSKADCGSTITSRLSWKGTFRNWASTYPPEPCGVFGTMTAHYHGQIMNYSELGRSFGISDMTARKYIDILEGTFMLRILQAMVCQCWQTGCQKAQDLCSRLGNIPFPSKHRNTGATDVDPQIGRVMGRVRAGMRLPQHRQTRPRFLFLGMSIRVPNWTFFGNTPEETGASSSNTPMLRELPDP